MTVPGGMWMLQGAMRLLSLLPLPALFRFSQLLGLVVARTPNQIARNTRKNIQLCFKHLSKTEQLQLYRRSVQHTCCSVIELAAIWYKPLPQVIGYTRESHIDAEFLTSKQGKILILPHFGSWEYINPWLSRKMSLMALYKPNEEKQGLNEFVLEQRKRKGVELAPTNTSGIRTLFKALKQNYCCIVLPDQKPPKETAQIKAPFFGYPASTSLLVTKLVQKTEAEVYICGVTRDFNAPGYSIHIQALPRDGFVQTEYESARFLNHSIERLIEQNVEQYQWAYKRFSRKTYRLLEP